jgi:2-polyprenyl-3-methyl-5-hydroxy-6-metoxy-1,4-benzoquinol methylase
MTSILLPISYPVITVIISIAKSTKDIYMNNLSQQEKNALESQGISDSAIYNSIISELKTIVSTDKKNIADVGCGEGHLLRQVSKTFNDVELSGVDLVEYPNNNIFKFVKQNFNESFNNLKNSYDIVLAIEVIEHLENPRHFLRELAKILVKDGRLIISTPNPYSYLSLLSYFLKGFHSSFGPKNYPAHITAISTYDLHNMINEIEELELVSTSYISNGRMPGTSLHWQNLFPFLKGKRFSDNYYCVIKKN